jgi:nucleoside-diphosphate-sugar epimerase
VNVEGTKRLLDIATGCGADIVHYISTAYVAGTSAGIIPEARVPRETRANNVYEQSKIDAESAIFDHRGITAQILRPSVIVGHSTKHHALSDFGVYGFLGQLATFYRRISRTAEFGEEQLSVIAEPEQPLNIVPIDLVVAQAVQLSTESSEVVHLTNDTPPTVAQVIDAIFDAAQVPRPRYVAPGTDLTAADLLLNRALDFYNSYIKGHKIFAQRAPLKYEYDEAALFALCDHYAREKGILARAKEEVRI